MDTVLDKLSEMLASLPGLGPRQARRLAYALIRRDAAWLTTFLRTLESAHKSTRTCCVCNRTFFAESQASTCSICADTSRDHSMLLLVERDVDLEHIEQVGIYKGVYYVLGGTVRILEKNPEQKIAVSGLTHTLESRIESGELKEVIFGLSATPHGEDTMQYVRDTIAPLLETHALRATVFGRGLSTGSELEYADRATLEHAFKARR